jgi:hypothetical protein
LTDQIYQLKEKVYIEAFEDGALVLRLVDRSIFQFNLTALKVLELTDGAHSIEDIAGSIASTFSITEEEAATDIAELYAHLRNEELIESITESKKEC